MRSLVEDLFSLTVFTKSSMAVFFAEKLYGFLQKFFITFFSEKKKMFNSIFAYNTFEIITLNNIVSFKQLGPEAQSKLPVHGYIMFFSHFFKGRKL